LAALTAPILELTETHPPYVVEFFPSFQASCFKWRVWFLAVTDDVKIIL
jgi:hypothetical protein